MPGYTGLGGDCDDGNWTIHPDAAEIPGDGMDQDCDGADAISCYLDADKDTYGSSSIVIAPDGSCDTAQGESTRNNDCNDSNTSISPAGTDKPGDDWDENCSGKIACYQDNDNDTYGSLPGGESNYNATGGVSTTSNACASSNTDNWDNSSNDCNDFNAAINPTAMEIPANGIDENCDGKD
jgi:hypothetical protein